MKRIREGRDDDDQNIPWRGHSLDVAEGGGISLDVPGTNSANTDENAGNDVENVPTMNDPTTPPPAPLLMDSGIALYPESQVDAV